MLAQQIHGIHEIAVKSALLACTGEKGSLSCLWEKTTAIVLTNYSPTVVGSLAMEFEFFVRFVKTQGLVMDSRSLFVKRYPSQVQTLALPSGHP